MGSFQAQQNSGVDDFVDAESPEIHLTQRLRAAHLGCIRAPGVQIPGGPTNPAMSDASGFRRHPRIAVAL
jgi:hypothetical protein